MKIDIFCDIFGLCRTILRFNNIVTLNEVATCIYIPQYKFWCEVVLRADIY